VPGSWGCCSRRHCRAERPGLVAAPSADHEARQSPGRPENHTQRNTLVGVGPYRVGASVPAMDTRRRRSGVECAGRTRPTDPDPRPEPGSTGPDPGIRPEPGQPTVYQIRVRGHLDDRWSDAGEGVTVTLEASGDTLLTAPVVDQAALYGLLRTLRDLGAPLVSINPAGPDLPGISPSKEMRR
jgi:hypothetical protein